jgi:hypothetical protein
MTITNALKCFSDISSHILQFDLNTSQSHANVSRQQELRDLISNSETVTESTESPDIGPPPISQFVDEDPVKIDLPRRQQRVDAGDGDDLGPALSFNLEQRRKRRESSGLNGQSGNDTIVVSTVPVQEVREPLKAGAKRKLSVREDDDQGSRIQRTQSSPDDFKFTRVVSDDEVKDTAMTQPETVNIKSSRELAVARGVSREKKPTAINNSMRKVLAPKSVNSSPKKTASRVVVDEIKAAKASVPRSGLGKDLSRECNREPILVKSDLGAAINTIEVQPEPETPAAVHIFSPSSSHPSTARPIDNRDTPPPSELNSGTEAVRPSRRARGAISYTEPSLRDKMRRPSKALADAVNRDGKIVQGSSVKAEDGSAPSLIIKTEPEDEDAWKRMPTASVDTLENSPLRAKATESDLLPSSITTHRKRRESILQQGPSSEEKSASENAISSLVAEHRKAKAFAREKAIEQESSRLTATMENLNVNESAELCPTDISTSKSVDDSKLKARPTRRQSSVPRDLTATEDGEASDIEATKRRQVTVTRRRQSTLDMQSGAAAPNGRIQSSLKKSYSSQDMTNDAHGDARSDRISARRRSMML